jgi:hypothetical protein
MIAKFYNAGQSVNVFATPLSALSSIRLPAWRTSHDGAAEAVRMQGNGEASEVARGGWDAGRTLCYALTTLPPYRTRLSYLSLWQQPRRIAGDDRR